MEAHPALPPTRWPNPPIPEDCIVRLLHTADWHLGQTLHDFDRSYEHRCFLNWLLDTLEREQIDALLIAGDVFDNPNPAAEAQKQFYYFLTEAKRRTPHLAIVIIAGNHDSAGRLEAPAPLLQPFDITVVGAVSHTAHGAIDTDRLIVPLRNREGEIVAWCLAVPFLRPGDVPRVETDGDPYPEGVRQLYRRTLEAALHRRSSGQAIVALGHCHLMGGQPSTDSERRIVIGGAEALPADVFAPEIGYAALGHLHRAQRVGGQEHVRYSGSPLPMSFAEIDYPHQVVRIDLDGGVVQAIAALPVPRPVELLRIPDQPAALADVLERLHALAVPERPHAAQPYLQLRIRLTAPEPGLRARIEAALAGKPVRLARIETRYPDSVGGAAEDRLRTLDDLGRLKPEDIFQQLYRRKYQTEPTPELLAAFTELLLAAERERAA